MNKNPISLFYHVTFHTAFEQSESLAIALELIRLCDNFPEQFKDDFELEIDKIRFVAKEQISFCHNQQSFHPAKLSTVYNKIKRKSLIGELFFAAFLCIDCSIKQDCLIRNPDGSIANSMELDDRTYFEVIHAYKCLILVSAYRLLYADDVSRAQRACDEIRYFIDGRRKPKHYELPALPYFNCLEDFFDAMNSLASYKQKGPTNHYVEYIGPIKNAAVYCKPHYPSHPELLVLNTNSYSSKAKKTTISELKRRKRTPRTKQISLLSHPDDLNKDFTATEMEKLLLVTETTKEAAKPIYQQVLAEKEKQKSISNRNRRLPCDISTPESYAIEIFLSKFSSWQGKAKEEITMKFLLLSLYLGRSLADLPNLDFRFNTHLDCYDVYYSLDLPQPYEKKKRFHEKMYSHSNEYFLRLPRIFNKTIPSLHMVDQYLNTAKKLLRLFNRTNQIHLTISKIASYLETYLLNKGISNLLIHLLTEPNPNHQVALYYTHTSTKTLEKIHRDYIQHLQTYSANFQLMVETSDNYFFIGSKVIHCESAISSYFYSLKRITRENIDKYHRKDIALHNAFSLYTYLVLSISSGYRPVTNTLGYISDINLDIGIYFISDKDRGDKVEGRVNYLGKTALQQLQHYLDFCRFQYLSHQQKNPQLANHYQQVLSAEIPLIFFRTKDSILKPSPSILTKQLSAHNIRLPLNWGRHYIRSLLAENNFADSVIHAWMGHDDDAGQIPFSLYSSICCEDLRKVADFIDLHIEQLGVEAISYAK